MSATRLPKKTLMEISGKPLIEHVIKRIQLSKRVNEIIVATTSNKIDDELVQFVKKLKVKCYRGSEEDVLGRMLEAAKSVDADIFVRMAADRPFADPEIIDSVIKLFFDENPDLASNSTLVQPFPVGLDVEVCSIKTLEKISSQTNEKDDREHVTLYFYKHPEEFKISYFKPDAKLKRPELRLTVDTEEDMIFTRKVYDKLYGKNPFFSARDVVNLINKEPNLAKINQAIKQVKPV